MKMKGVQKTEDIVNYQQKVCLYSYIYCIYIYIQIVKYGIYNMYCIMFFMYQFLVNLDI